MLSQIFTSPVDFILHVDRYVGQIIQNYGVLSYFILFLVIFLETGLVITPFLPGDSLLFITGAFASSGYLNIFIVFFVFLFAAVLGDSVNYLIGSYFGEKLFSGNRFFKKEHLEKTKGFYKKHGGKTIILARFVPIVRTFAPFVAGIGKMEYKRFLSFNLLGGLLWVSLFTFAGYYFGKIPVVQENLTLVIMSIIVISLIPIFIEFLRNRKKR
ncbi:SNARE associated Golgi protein [uncultured archaeon]|nr:SNARE associated Golgi protein [uncultured archaeon]